MEPSERAPKILSDEEKPGWLKCELTVNTCEKAFQGRWGKKVRDPAPAPYREDAPIRPQLSHLEIDRGG